MVTQGRLNPRLAKLVFNFKLRSFKKHSFISCLGIGPGFFRKWIFIPFFSPLKRFKKKSMLSDPSPQSGRSDDNLQSLHSVRDSTEIYFLAQSQFALRCQERLQSNW